jgi:exo-beta-1,3-glucanase (GH17 family)
MAFFGVCYSPYRLETTPPPHMVPESQVDADIKQIATAGFKYIRTYSQGGASDGNIWNVPAAAKHGLKVGLGVWIVPDDDTLNEKRIDTAWAQLQAHPTAAMHLVIGNEVNRTDSGVYSPSDVLKAVKYAIKQRAKYSAVLPNTYVTVCFSGTVLQYAGSPWQEVVQACESVVYLTVYPWYGGAQQGNINENMEWSWSNGMQQVTALGKKVIIAEIGWPSANGRETSIPNEQINYGVTQKWVSGQNKLKMAFDTYWFEMYDEPWKTAEGAYGPYWGLCHSNGKQKFQFSARVGEQPVRTAVEA